MKLTRHQHEYRKNLYNCETFLFKWKQCFNSPYFENQFKCRGLQFCLTLLEVDMYNMCPVQINQSSNPIHCKPSYHALISSHGDQNVVIESFPVFWLIFNVKMTIPKQFFYCNQRLVDILEQCKEMSRAVSLSVNGNLKKA